MNAPTVYTYQDMVMVVDHVGSRDSVVCRSGGEAIGAVIHHGKVVNYKGAPCLVEVTWDPLTNCWVGTICGTPATQCTP